MRIEVDQKVFEEFNEIRDSGEVNMFDFEAVKSLANERECHNLLSWMSSNKDEYLEALFTGFDQHN